jgi:hypothetical protein
VPIHLAFLQAGVEEQGEQREGTGIPFPTESLRRLPDGPDLFRGQHLREGFDGLGVNQGLGGVGRQDTELLMEPAEEGLHGRDAPPQGLGRAWDPATMAEPIHEILQIPQPDGPHGAILAQALPQQAEIVGEEIHGVPGVIPALQVIREGLSGPGEGSLRRQLGTGFELKQAGLMRHRPHRWLRE